MFDGERKAARAAAVLLSAVVCVLALTVAGAAAARAADPSDATAKAAAASGGPTVAWREAGTERRAFVSPDELAVFFTSGSNVSPSRMRALARRLGALAGPLEGSNEFVMFVRLPAGDMSAAAVRVATGLHGVPWVSAVSPVCYLATRDPGARMALTGEVIVRLRPGGGPAKARGLASAEGLARPQAIGAVRRAWLARAPSALASLSAANDLAAQAGVQFALPNWYRACATRAVPTDTLFAQQWYLRNSGQGGGMPGADVNIVTVWDSFKGHYSDTDPQASNQVIAIVDDAVQIAHPDLARNVVPGVSWDFVGDDGNPSPAADDEVHGTACAGVAAARGFNSVGVCGTAPRAGLVGFRMLGADLDTVRAAAMRRSENVVDIRSNSWGPEDDRHLEGPGPLVAAALADGAGGGRGGRGTVFVWAGGNGRQEGDNANYDGYANSRYVIAVGACDNFGRQAYYSEPGANLAVCAPSSGGTLAVTTTDRTGGAGYSSGDYTSGFGGTSATSPLVAGTAALMLQANPDLTWRDVRAILMTTAAKNDAADADWQLNGAGYHVDHKYGFGRVDAQAAVAAAATWRSFGPEVVAQAGASPGAIIPDSDAAGVTSQVTVSENMSIEYVEVYLTTSHLWWPDLQVELTSPEAPSGAVSVLAEATDTTPIGDGFNDWRFGTARSFGEQSQGTWTLRVSDRFGGITGTFDSWTLKVYGHEAGSWVDRTTPTTIARGAAGWHRRPAAVTLVATDPDSAVDHTEYRLDSGGWTTGSALTVDAPRNGANDGDHLLEFRSYDTGGGPTEAIERAHVKIDTQGPRTIAPRAARVRRGRYVTLRYRVDDDLSPRARVTIRIATLDGRTIRTFRLGGKAVNVTFGKRFRCDLAPRTYRFWVYARDLAGNRQTVAGRNRLVVRR